ncbi:MAG: GNAT family N-acetyltransferase, partial [Hyphomicrobiales bacterium]|nr:GNAT family N-acetyltransferase [Hyphomicrobiales bacterium]
IDASGYLDQLVVAPAHWGSDVARLLMDEAKRLSPSGVTLKVNADNARAIGFYLRHGFVKTGDEVNASGRAVDVMAWMPI